MAIHNRPATVDAVHAALKADADFRGIPEHAQTHYLLGMCEARLAQANAEVIRLERELSRAENALERLGA